jgi:quercetin dioxygenase-like cupin family protein
MKGGVLMIEKKYTFTFSDTKTIERIVSDENADINHMILPKGDALPEHYTNSNVYMIIVHGNISLQLDDQEEHIYTAGSIIAIPYKIKMNARNNHEEVLEFFVVKAPSPKTLIK